jgi:alkylresorcinol/alkylpyrone synthase
MKIAGAAGAFPPHRYHQYVITDTLRVHWGEKLQCPELLTRLHSRTGVDYRNFAFPLADYERFETWGQSNRAWMEVAEQLGEKAVDGALERAGVTRRDLDALFVVSITGVASPSLDARLINRMTLRPDIKRTPIFGLGCVGGATGLTRAADYVRAYPTQAAALLAVEVCSLTLQRDDVSTPNLISTGLFGDGAAAVIVVGAERPSTGPAILGTRSVFYPDSEEIMGWDISEKGFRVVLSPKLPDLIQQHLGADLDRFLADFALSRRDIGNWVIHTGGPKILEAVERALGLSDHDLKLSWDSLRRHGNISSASVLLVLEETMTSCRPEPGTLGLLAAMGPGFCSELILIQW